MDPRHDTAAHLTVRPPEDAELEGVYALVMASDLREFGEPEYDAEEFRTNWRDLDLANDSRVAALPDGRLIGWIVFEDEPRHLRFFADGYVHPDFEGQGAGSALLRWAEERATSLIPEAPDGFRIVLHTAFGVGNQRAHELVRRLGYHEVRHFWRMRIRLDPEALPPPSLPAGITVRAVNDEADERRVHAAVQEAFRDHWGSSPRPFERWAERKKRHGFHPDLWLMAFDGEEVAGAVVGSIYPEQGGWVNDVAVRRPWRRRGLARAMLHEIFRRFAARGQRTVHLGVDATNPTGATRLYESVGMEVVREFVIYEKELRPGREPEPDESE